jgi:SOS-response transcriptional repressor LexA
LSIDIKLITLAKGRCNVLKYADLLSSYIEKSGLTLDQITEICKKNGVTIHPTYISKLRKGLRPAPTEDISKALAEACGQSSDKLVFVGYLEKTPSPIIEKFVEYEEIFYVVKKALLELCNDAEFLDRLSKKVGQKMTFEKMCILFDNLSLEEQLKFITSSDFSFNMSETDKGEINVWLGYKDDAETLLIPEDAVPVSNMHVVDLPVYGEVCAGIGGYAFKDYLGSQKWVAKNGNCKDYYMLQIRGDSMIPRFLPGDFAVVRPQNDVDNGEIAIVIIDNEEGVIKRIKKYTEGIVLKSDNSLYEDREFYGKESNRVRIIGKVIDIKAGRL